MEIISTIATLAHNPVFAGVVGGGALGGALLALRSAPVTLWKYSKRFCTVSLSVRGNLTAYDYLDNWMMDKDFTKKATIMQLARAQDDVTGGYQFALGQGAHLIRHAGRYFWVERTREQGKATTGWGGTNDDEHLTITTWGRSQKPIRALYDEAVLAYHGPELISIYHWNEQHYREVDRRQKRDLATVYVPDSQKQGLIDDLQDFLNNRAVYAKRGTPWRRGYLLRGQPGTGKTSLVFGIASHFNMPIHVINLSNVGGDQGLQNAMSEAKEGIILMEDIDSVAVTHDRGTISNKSDLSDDQGNATLTLAGILNAIDGVASREGRILFVTSNHADVLDPALKRAGRIDVDETIEPLCRNLAIRMAKAFDDNMTVDDLDTLVVSYPIPAANLQGLLIKHTNALPKS